MIALLSSTYVAVQVLSDVSSIRLVEIFGRALDGGTFIYPITFTLRDVVHKDPARVRLVEVLDPGVVMDMDTPEDYRKILKSYQHSRP